MRVLLVDHDSEGLEAIARAIRGVIELDCVTSKGDAMLLLRQNPYDVLIACERAVDGSGLDLLGRTTKTAVPLKRIFAAAPERLQLLGPRLAPFKVQRTINYPIDLEELWLAIAQVTSGPNDDTDGTIEHVVLDERGQSSSTSRSGVRRQPAFAAPAAPVAAPPAPAPQAPAPMTAAASGAARPATIARIAPKTPLPPSQPMLPHASTGTSGSYRAPVVTRAPPPMRATAPVPQMPPMSPMPVAPSLNSVTNPAPAWVAEPTPEDDFAAVAAQARMGVQQKNSQEAARRGKSRVVIASTAAVLVAGAVFAFQNFYDPGRAEREARQAAIAAEATRLAEAQKHTDNVSRVEIEIETAIMNNQLDAARHALANLTTLAPEHPRREFLSASITRAAELAALSSAQNTRGSSRTRSVLSEDEVREQRATRAAAEAPPPARAVSAPARSNAPGNAGSGNTRLAANSERARPSSSGSASINIPPPRPRPDVTFSGRTLEASDQRPATRTALSASTSIPPGVSGISSAPSPVPDRVPLPVAPPIGASIASAVPGANVAAPVTASTSGAGANVPVPSTPVNVKPAKILKRVNPVMPSVAAQKKLKGYVVLAYVIDAEGRVRDVEVTESTPERIFDLAARDAVRKWTFEPRTENGVPVESKKTVKLIFE
jgi:TonB family protein